MPTLLHSGKVTIDGDSKISYEHWDFSDVVLGTDKWKEAVALVASISYGNDAPKNPERLYDTLLSLGHESPFEFVRIPYIDDEGRIRAGIEDSLRNSLLPNPDLWPEGKKTAVRVLHRKSIAVFKVQVPIYSARQIMRHRSFSYLEMSRRYTKDSKVPFEFFIPPFRIWGIKASIASLVYSFTTNLTKLSYKLLQRLGIRAEVSRGVIPVSAMTKFWLMSDYKGWLGFFVERLLPEAQFETRKLAEAMLRSLVFNQAPFVDMMVEYGRRWVKHYEPKIESARRKKYAYFVKRVEDLIKERDKIVLRES